MMVSDDDVEIDEIAHKNDINKAGYLQKKTSKGLWVSRYFVTDSRYLRYWHDREQCEKSQKACEEFDLAEVSGLEKADAKLLKVKFLKNTKFQLTLKAETEEELNEWTEIIRGKVKLYSVDELLAELQGERVSFRTKTFQILLLLSEKEQNKWILNRLDEAFESDQDEQRIVQMRDTPVALLRAACRAFDEFLDICADCKAEMTSRSPRIIAHSRNYMQRYADILKGRTMLELLYLPGVESKHFELIGEQGLCVALELAQKLEEIKQFPFVPKSFISTLSSSLFSFGDLFSSLLNLALRRVDAFFDVLAALPVELHAKKLGDALLLVGEFVQLVRGELSSPGLFAKVTEKVMTTLLLSFNDHFLHWAGEGYDERHFIQHIEVCDKIHSQVSLLFLDPSSKSLVILSPSEAIPPGGLGVPPAVREGVQSTCSLSALLAVQKLVSRLQHSKQYLLQGLLVELNMAWLDGQLLGGFVLNLDQWSLFLSQALPARFGCLVYCQLARLMLCMYVRKMMERYRETKRPVGEVAVRQIVQDLAGVKSWISKACGGEAQGAEGAGGAAGAGGGAAEQQVIILLQSFLLCSQKDLPQAFAEGVLSFGLSYSLHLYDLLRLCLKYRGDVSDIDRRGALGLCFEFSQQMRRAVEGDSFSFSLPPVAGEVLEELLPGVGVKHCTGKRWGVVSLSDPLSKERMGALVGQACNKALLSKRKTRGVKGGSRPPSPLPAGEGKGEEQSEREGEGEGKKENGEEGEGKGEGKGEGERRVVSLQPPPLPPRRRATVSTPCPPPPPPPAPPSTSPLDSQNPKPLLHPRPVPPPPPPKPPRRASTSSVAPSSTAPSLAASPLSSPALSPQDALQLVLEKAQRSVEQTSREGMERMED